MSVHIFWTKMVHRAEQYFFRKKYQILIYLLLFFIKQNMKKMIRVDIETMENLYNLPMYLS